MKIPYKILFYLVLYIAIGFIINPALATNPDKLLFPLQTLSPLHTIPPSWFQLSPDRKKMAYIDFINGTFQLRIIDMQTNKIIIPPTVLPNSFEPSWRSDSQEIVFLASVDNEYLTDYKQVMVFNCSANVSIPITTIPGRYFSPCFAGRHRGIYFIEQSAPPDNSSAFTSKIFYAERNALPLEELYAGQGIFNSLRSSQDGGKLFFFSFLDPIWPHGIGWIYDRHRSTVQQIPYRFEQTEFGGSYFLMFGCPLAIEPDWSALYFSSGQNIVAIDLARNTARRITKGQFFILDNNDLICSQADDQLLIRLDKQDKSFRITGPQGVIIARLAQNLLVLNREASQSGIYLFENREKQLPIGMIMLVIVNLLLAGIIIFAWFMRRNKLARLELPPESTQESDQPSVLQRITTHNKPAEDLTSIDSQEPKDNEDINIDDIQATLDYYSNSKSSAQSVSAISGKTELEQEEEIINYYQGKSQEPEIGDHTDNSSIASRLKKLT